MTARKAISAKDMGALKIVNMANGTAATDAVTKGQLDANSAFDISRNNHTGTQLANTIADFDTQVRLTRLDQLAAPAADVSLASHKLVSVTDPTAAQDAATKAYVDAQLAGLSSGLVMKGSVRAAVASNVNTAAPGTTLDGLTAANGDVFLLTGQTTGSQNGPYVYNGSAAAMTRATNFDTTAEAVPGSYWIVREGSKADQLAILTNDTYTLGTTTATFTYVVPGGSTDVDVSYTETCPATAAGATWTVTHNLNTRAVTVQVYRTASPYDEVDVYTTRDTVNTVGITPDVALASGEYTVVVVKVA